MQEPDGGVPWTVGEHTDVWNHIESAMALLVGGQVAAADRAFQWCLDTQREDGSWPMKIVGGAIEDHSGETNMSAYLAVGVWHNWLVRRDFDFVRRHWPAVRRALDWVVRHAAAVGRDRAGPRSGPTGARRRSTARRCWPARRASTTRCAPGSRSPS